MPFLPSLHDVKFMKTTVAKAVCFQLSKGLCGVRNDIADIPLGRILPVNAFTAFLPGKVKVPERKDFLKITTGHASL